MCMKEWYRISGKAVLKEMQVSESGLTESMAESILQGVGENVLREEGRKSFWNVFLEQFQDLLVVILLVAAVISMISGNGESAAVIFAVILLNAVLGTLQHEKAQKSLDSLKALSAPTARVLRNGRQVEIPARKVVPGDILLLEAGDLVAADGRLLECYSLMVNESSLTGESGVVEKQPEILDGEQVALADRSNMVFSGSLVTGGRGMAVITSTGMNTEIGRIAELMNETDEKKTPLQVSLDQFGGRLAMVILVICGLVFALSLYRKTPVLDSLMFAVALAVAAIPEALGSIVTIVQAMGTQQMAKEHAIIKDLKAVESLGCVSVICSDKTGTLTQNRMNVQQVFADGKVLLPGQLSPYQQVHRYFLYTAVLDNDAVPGNGMVSGSGMVLSSDAVTKYGRVTENAGARNGAGGYMGDPTEIALLEMAEQTGMDIGMLRKEVPRLFEIPFDSGRKRMSTLHRIDGKNLLLAKGAVDVLLERTDWVMTEEGVCPMTGGWKQRILEQNQSWSQEGLRVLGMACKEVEEGWETSKHVVQEDHFIWIGMAAMIDPPRIESRTAVLSARRAGIRPVMITGDHMVTAAAIARRIGLLEKDSQVISGMELDQMDDRQLHSRLDRIAVYARVSPEHKIRIVKAWQSKGHIVAMTGDGVNDAPALKKADIGVAMGIAGTEVSKDAASMVLTDDNFATIIRAVSNGRNVYRNIRHAIQFLLSGNMAGIFCVLYTSLCALPMPFAPVHLLFINLLTDSLPAIAIGMEPQEEGLLQQPPRDPREGILNRTFLTQIMVQGALIAVCTMFSYHIGMETGGVGTASTMAFAALTLARLFHGFNCRSQHSIIRIGLLSNFWSLLAFEAGVVLLAAVLFLPGLQVLFAVADLSVQQIAAIVVFAVIPTVVIQAVKTVQEALG